MAFSCQCCEWSTISLLIIILVPTLIVKNGDTVDVNFVNRGQYNIAIYCVDIIYYICDILDLVGRNTSIR